MNERIETLKEKMLTPKFEAWLKEKAKDGYRYLIRQNKNETAYISDGKPVFDNNDQSWKVNFDFNMYAVPFDVIVFNALRKDTIYTFGELTKDYFKLEKLTNEMIGWCVPFRNFLKENYKSGYKYLAKERDGRIFIYKEKPRYSENVNEWLPTDYQYNSLMIPKEITFSNTFNATIIYDFSELFEEKNYNYKFEIGDTVEVVDNGKTFTTYEEWFKENNCKCLALDYKENQLPNCTFSYKVIARGRHRNSLYSNIYAIKVISFSSTNQIYLIGEDGLKKKEEQTTVRGFKQGRAPQTILDTYLYPSTPLREISIKGSIGGGNSIFNNLYNSFMNYEGEQWKHRINPQEEIKLVYVNHKKGQVCIKWGDGTTTKATCSKNDDFDTNVGFAVAFTRKFFKSDRVLDKFLDKKLVKNKKKKEKE